MKVKQCQTEWNELSIVSSIIDSIKPEIDLKLKGMENKMASLVNEDDLLETINKRQKQKEEREEKERKEKEEKERKERELLLIKETTEKSMSSFGIDLEKAALLKEAVSRFVSSPRFVLLFQASVHGFAASAFHQRCDGKGPTLFLVRNQHGKTFGGFASKSWESPSMGDRPIPDEMAVFFSVDLKKIFKQKNPVKMPFSFLLTWMDLGFPFLFGPSTNIQIQLHLNSTFVTIATPEKKAS